MEAGSVGTSGFPCFLSSLDIPRKIFLLRDEFSGLFLLQPVEKPTHTDFIDRDKNRE